MFDDCVYCKIIVFSNINIHKYMLCLSAKLLFIKTYKIIVITEPAYIILHMCINNCVLFTCIIHNFKK